MSDVFESLSWHDAELLELTIDRRSAGVIDEVRLLIRWPDGKDDLLVFSECLSFVCSMNFGVIAEESILTASCLLETPELAALREKWKSFPQCVLGLKCFEIETNSTGSLLRIYAKRFYTEANQDITH